MYQEFHPERNPMYVFLNLKFMYQMAGAVLSLLICDRFEQMAQNLYRI